MFAVVTKYDKFPHSRRYKLEFSDPVCRISVGEKLSKRRLKRLLEPFGGLFLADDCVDLHGLQPFDTTELRETVLFKQFCDRVLELTGVALSVGIFDPAGKYLDLNETTEIIAHAASTTVFTYRNAETLCRRWLATTGTCPEIVEKKAWLFGCDCVFAPQGLKGFNGELFGVGGNSVDSESLYIPDDIVRFLSNKVDKIDLYCLLKAEKSIFDAKSFGPTPTVM